MSSILGKNIKVSLFGQSHGPAVGVVMDGVPAGEIIDEEQIASFLLRRAPRGGVASTARVESDAFELLSGVSKGRSTGFPICAVIRNNDVRSEDYEAMANMPRPSHADYPAYVKYGGFADMRGGGHFSARLTAPLCFAGAVCKSILSKRGVTVGAHILSIGDICDTPFDPMRGDAEYVLSPGRKIFPVIDDEKWGAMRSAVEQARMEGDSLGGVVECCAVGVPCGVGEPLFNGLESLISAAIFAIPAVRGVEFGAGFDAARMKGSAHNDPYTVIGGEVKTTTNNHGGILGGIATGMPIVLRAAFKPTPSIYKPQQSVDLGAMADATLNITGRHDPCVAIRAVPCVEAAVAIALLDMMEERGNF